jgi:hypothetical protein
MSLTELIPALQALSHTDKLRLLQVLVFELAQEEGVSLVDPNLSYPIWTPYNAVEAADTLLQALEMDKSINGN